MIEILRKFENRDIKIARVNSIHISKSINYSYLLSFYTVLGSVMIGGDFPCSVKALYTVQGLGVCECSPEGLHDNSVSWIPNTDEILKLLKKKMN